MDTHQNSRSLSARLVSLLALCAILSACGGGGGGGGGGDDAVVATSSSSTFVGGVTLDWSSPLYREDGTPIHPDDIDAYTIKYKKIGDSNYQTLIVSGDSDSIELNIDSPGQYEFIISATDHDGAQSAYTSPIYGTIA